MEVILITMSSCTPCKLFKPIFEKVANDHPHIEFREIDGAKHEKFTDKYNVMSVPTVLILDENNEVLERLHGSLSETRLLTALVAASLTES